MLEFTDIVWRELIAHLSAAGGGMRESGAFLLGVQFGQRRVVSEFLPYEELQADALNDDYVELHAEAFSKLWDRVHESGKTVVGDVHTHRFGPRQSYSDRMNPMIALTGHIATIVPNFAQGDISPLDLGVHVYQGRHKWRSYFYEHVAQVLTVRSGNESD